MNAALPTVSPTPAEAMVIAAGELGTLVGQTFAQASINAPLLSFDHRWCIYRSHGGVRISYSLGRVNVDHEDHIRIDSNPAENRRRMTQFVNECGEAFDRWHQSLLTERPRIVAPETVEAAVERWR